MSTPEKVTFPSWSCTVVGNLYIPSTTTDSTKAPRKNAAIVISHPMSSVKEQTPALYAQALTDHGFTTLTFDAAYQGESTGEPRGYENPYQRVEDIKSAVTYLTTLSTIDPSRIGVLGICASGGYVLNAAQGDVRMRAVATVSGADIGRMTREGLHPKGAITPAQVQAALTASTDARTAEANGSKPITVLLLPDSQSDLPDGTPDLSKEAWTYYKTPRGAHPRANSVQPIRSVDLLVNYDSFAFNYLISPRPLLMIVGSDADTAYHSRDAIALAKEPKELFVIPGKTHVALYDDLSDTVPKLVEFFDGALAALAVLTA